MECYLYGASLQGIQAYIFATNKLKEIVGASEIIEQICTSEFKKFLKEKDVKDVEVILSAAGNIKLKADSKEAFECIVREFPKHVAKMAPGLIISQAVVYCKEKITRKDMSLLEKRLKIQRNLPMAPVELTGLGILRSRRTGKSAVTYMPKEREFYDLTTMKKVQSVQSGEESNTGGAHNRLSNKFLNNKVPYKKIDNHKIRFPLDLTEITHSKISNWLAVIHADGNGLGKQIQSLTNKSTDAIENLYKDFSSKLDSATCGAAHNAFASIVLGPIEKGEITPKYFPMRPIVLGGDDLTVICRADLALAFVKKYLENFKTETENEFGKGRGLSAAAGIAFVKESYPFHYAIDLAEELCGEAKAKSRENACVAFHKIESSFFDSYESIKKRALCAGDISFVQGPYDLNELEQLQKRVKAIQEKNSPKSGIRKWLSELHNNQQSAKQLMARIIEITKQNGTSDGTDFVKVLGLDKPIDDVNKKTHLYDVLTIASLHAGV